VISTVFVFRQSTRWKLIYEDGLVTKWQKGAMLHVDTNHDGVVDEEYFPLPGTNHFRVKRDSDFDGWFDLGYESKSGIATGIEKIREKAPRH
jgi:hypothetical protein